MAKKGGSSLQILMPAFTDEVMRHPEVSIQVKGREAFSDIKIRVELTHHPFPSEDCDGTNGLIL